MSNSKFDSDFQQDIAKSMKNKVSRKKVVLGVLIIALGILLILNNFDLLGYYVRRLIFSWQMLLIAIGTIYLAEKRSRWGGVILIAVGGFFILPRLVCMPDDYVKNFWPLLIIAAGVVITSSALKNYTRSKISNVQQSIDFIDDVNVFGSAKRVIKTDNFKGGKSVNLLSGAVYDFTECKISGTSQLLRIVCILGGVDIIVPKTWNVQIDSATIFGGIDNKRKDNLTEVDTSQTLMIKGTVILGGCNILRS